MTPTSPEKGPRSDVEPERVAVEGQAVSGPQEAAGVDPPADYPLATWTHGDDEPATVDTWRLDASRRTTSGVFERPRPRRRGGRV